MTRDRALVSSRTVPWLRVSSYVMAIAVAGLLPWLDVLWSNRQHPLFIENSVAQKLQLGLLLATIACFVNLAIREHDHRSLALLLMLFFAAMAIREMDSDLDYWLFDGAWQMMVGGLLVPAVWLMIRSRALLVSSARQWVPLRSFGLMLVGVSITILFSRLFGKEDLWHALMTDGYQRSAKNMAEEGLEVLGYVLILIASLDTAHQLCRRRK